MTAKGEPSYRTMFSSLLRRPRRGSRRVDIHDLAVSPSSVPHLRHRQYTDTTHATADFTEADDDDDDDDTNEEDLVRFDEDAGQANDQDQVDHGEDDGPNEDDRNRVLPVLPLFSATHLGKFTPFM